MIAIRCTKKLLDRIGAPSLATAPTTAILGDWYARPVAAGHQRLILLISEHSRLPVVMSARDVKQLAANFPDALAAVLWGLGLSAAVIQGELEAASEAVIAKTNSRSHLGTLIDFSYLLAGYAKNADRARPGRSGTLAQQCSRRAAWDELSRQGDERPADPEGRVTSAQCRPAAGNCCVIANC